VELSTTAIFGDLCGYFFGNVRLPPSLTQSPYNHMVIMWGLSDNVGFKKLSIC